MDAGGASMNKLTVELHLGDCLEVMRSMPDKSVDCIFADPPFNANKNYKCDFNDNKPIEEYREWMGDCIGEMSRIIKPGGFIWLMQDQRNVGFCMMLLEKYGLDFRNIVTWIYTNPTPASRQYPKSWRPILLYSRGDPVFFNYQADEMTRPTLYYNPDRAKSHYPHDVWSDIPKLVGGIFAPKELITDEAGRFAHLAQMPVRISERVIKTSTNLGDVVLDPFMGSGTTGVACVQTGRSFIGIEISEEYFRIAEKRIAEAQKQPRLI